MNISSWQRIVKGTGMHLLLGLCLQLRQALLLLLQQPQNVLLLLIQCLRTRQLINQLISADPT